MLYALSYIGFTRTFSVDEFINDTKDGNEAVPVKETTEEKSELEMKIEKLMNEERIYLRKT